MKKICIIVRENIVIVFIDNEEVDRIQYNTIAEANTAQSAMESLVFLLRHKGLPVDFTYN